MADSQLENLGRELPYSREAEMAVIGSILADSESVAEAAEIIMADDFYFANNREIFAVVMELFNENSPIDFVTVTDRLKQKDKLEAVGGSEYLKNAVLTLSTTHHVTYYSEIIREKATLRELIKILRK